MFIMKLPQEADELWSADPIYRRVLCDDGVERDIGRIRVPSIVLPELQMTNYDISMLPCNPAVIEGVDPFNLSKEYENIVYDMVAGPSEDGFNEVLWTAVHLDTLPEVRAKFPRWEDQNINASSSGVLIGEYPDNVYNVTETMLVSDELELGIARLMDRDGFLKYDFNSGSVVGSIERNTITPYFVPDEVLKQVAPSSADSFIVANYV